MPSITVLDSAGVTQTVQTVPAVGSALSAASLPVVIASDQALWPATQPVSGTVTANISGTVPVSGTFWQATQPVSIATMPSTPVTGTFWQATQPVSLASLPALTTGAAVIGAVTQSGAWNVTNTAVTPTPLNISSAATTNATSIKGSAGTLYTVVASNVGAGAAFVKLYNLATSPTVGTSVPALTIPIPASGVVSLTIGETGHRFATGIALAITNLVADSDTTAVAAAQVKVLLDYI